VIATLSLQDEFGPSNVTVQMNAKPLPNAMPKVIERTDHDVICSRIDALEMMNQRTKYKIS
jgi:hypothetical protein